MKKKILTAVVVLCISTVSLGDAFRTFHDANGRALEARIKNYDPQTDSVIVELRNKSVKKVKASVFSEQDHAYIHDWYLTDALLSGILVDLSAKKITIDSGTDRDGQGEWKSYNSDMRYRDRNYKIVLENKSGLTLNSVKIEYCIYHQCTIEETRYLQPPEITLPPEKTIHLSQRVEDNVVSGMWDIPVLNNKQKLQHSTKSIHLRKGKERKDISGESITYSRELKDELPGLRLRLYTTLKSGEEIMKEYSFPDYLIEETRWEFLTNNISSEVPVLPRPENELVRLNFDKIKKGMSKEEVAHLVGYPSGRNFEDNDDTWNWSFDADGKKSTEWKKAFHIVFEKDVVMRVITPEI